MEAKEWKTLDRSEWAADPQWDDEPDKVQWPDESTGLPCLAVRNAHSGYWCGYVGVAEGHPSYGVNYDDVYVGVHGGLTFSDKCRPGNTEDRGICHIPGPGEPDHVWWLGFDCGHCMDYSPNDLKRAEERGGMWRIDTGSSYRTLAYVKEQCRQLAEQLANL